MGCTLLLFLAILLHDFSTTTSTFDESGDFATWAIPSRRFKLYIKVDSGGAPVVTGAPPDSTSSGKKTNVGAVVGFTFLLVFILVIFFVCIYRNRRTSSSPRTPTQQPAVVQPVRVQELVQKPAERALAHRLENKEVIEPKNGQDKVVGKKDDDKVVRPKRPNVGQGQGNEERDEKKKEVIEPRQKEGRDRGKRDGGDIRKKRVQVEVKGKEEDDDGIGRANKRVRDRKQPLQDENNVGREHKRGKEDVEEVPKKVMRELGKKPQEAVLEQQNSLGLPKKYTYKYLMSVTNNFDLKNRIGGGGFGTVYKGTLEDGTNIAVKCLRFEGRIDDFKNEVDALGKADHCNLVKLIGYCNVGLTRILVYEYMKNGSLDKWIDKSDPNRSLTWTEMKNIIRGIAEGLEYLHEKYHKKILHRDLKPPNVILDDNKNAKLCDFGIAKLLNKDQSSTSTAWAGTEGYMAPEVKKGKITDKIDVYSFGVVVLELVFGKRYTRQVNLHNLIKNLSEDRRKYGKEIEAFGKLAKWCLGEKPEERPTMSAIVAAIHGLEARFEGAKARRN